MLTKTLTAGLHVPTGIRFHHDTLRRAGFRGDNFCLTWAADDSQLTSMDDGLLIQNRDLEYHNHLYRIAGDDHSFLMQDVPGYPDFTRGHGGWFGYGLISIDGTLYSAISKTPELAWSGPFRGVKLLRSDDNGQTWARINRRGERRPLAVHDAASHDIHEEEMFFIEEEGLPYRKRLAYPFSYFDFVQCGKDNAAAKDNYVYIYSPEGARAHQLLLARAPRNCVGIRHSWEYFTGYDDDRAQWSSNIGQRRPIHTFPHKNDGGDYFGWYSWLPSVVWNKGLVLYIMANGGTYGGEMSDSEEDYYHTWMHTKSGSLGFWYASRPDGPWHQFFYTDQWVVDDVNNRTYQPKLSPKWISACGTKMTLVWSDAMQNEPGESHTKNYMWNQIAISLETDRPVQK